MEHSIVTFSGTVNGWDYRATYHLFREPYHSVYLAAARAWSQETGDEFESTMTHAWWQSSDPDWKNHLKADFFYSVSFRNSDGTLRTEEEIDSAVKQEETRRAALKDINEAVNKQIANMSDDAIIIWER